MLLIKANNIKKYFIDRLILDIKNLRIYNNDRIGIVGLNGVGKTTLMKILMGIEKIDSGDVKVFGNYSYIPQLTSSETTLSGGEKQKELNYKALSMKNKILFADEPTSNLDINAIEELQKQFNHYEGAIVLISHDREFLDSICKKIIEINNGKLKEYKGNYSDYIQQKKIEYETEYREYEKFIKEKRDIQKSIYKLKSKSSNMKKTPKRMGNSEARLHRKMGNQKAKSKLDKRSEALKTRLMKLDKKNKPCETRTTKFDIHYSEKIYSKILVEGKNINKSFGKKIILNNAHLTINNGDKIGLLGNNGCGKTTLIKMILNSESITLSQKINIGYFSQHLELLNSDKTLLAYIKENSPYDEAYIRLILARLLFNNDDVFKNISVLSGGEKIKASLAKLILSKYNMLILDEPTNYLDMESIKALEEVLSDFNGTLLLVSHDRRFLNTVTNSLLVFNNCKLTRFEGNYEKFLESKDILQTKKGENRFEKQQLMVIENKINMIIGKISTTSDKQKIEELDNKLNELLKEKKNLK
ncbi:ABC-F family ATP-binding cassette domain-containing protein [Clostridium sediminicola]|uniref:ribosomal protection-like ABC-F family protein n=1 Tax=Clostridium sediminicola TaxID=3114879 RepID=UPI0031F1C71D